MSEASTIFYKRANFVTHLPVGHRYTASHGWMAAAAPGRWRVGFTRFALRMLGEIVDVQLEKREGEAVAPGDIVGSIEGFKALSDIYCVGRGTFAGSNPFLREGLDRVTRDPYKEGWLYEFNGDPDGDIDVNSYRSLLDVTIDRILAKQQEGETAA